MNCPVQVEGESDSAATRIISQPALLLEEAVVVDRSSLSRARQIHETRRRKEDRLHTSSITARTDLDRGKAAEPSAFTHCPGEPHRMDFTPSSL